MPEAEFIYAPRLSHVPPVRPNASADLQRKIIACFKARFPEAETREDVDFEDFFECAIQLYMATHQGHRVLSVPEYKARGRFTESAPFIIGNGLSFAASLLEDDFGVEGVRPNLRVERLASRYYQLETFRRHAGRHFEVAAYPSDDPSETQNRNHHEVIQDMLKRGHAEVIYKVVAQNKAAILRLDAGAPLPEELGWIGVHHEGCNEGALIQEIVPMTAEYRVVVLDGQPVVGAGAIECFTPLDSLGKAFDTRVQGVRSAREGATRELGREEMRGLRRFTDQVAREIADEQPALTEYVLDVARIHDDWGIVELNPLSNYGFYALDAHQLLQSYAAVQRARPVVKSAPLTVTSNAMRP